MLSISVYTSIRPPIFLSTAHSGSGSSYPIRAYFSASAKRLQTSNASSTPTKSNPIPSPPVLAPSPSSPLPSKPSLIRRFARGVRNVLILGTGLLATTELYRYSSNLYKNADYNDYLNTLDSNAPPRKKVVVLGTGWGAIPFLKNIDLKHYDVTCVSPRNFFLMTPLLPSVSVGTIEVRTVTEAIRPLLGPHIRYVEAECTDVDFNNKKIHISQKPLRSQQSMKELPINAEHRFEPTNKEHSSSRVVVDSTRRRPDADLEYDYLVIAVGAENNTFNTPGVLEHAHFLKELPDARRIRAAISDCFESASIPGVSQQDKERLLNFVVVGGGPTGVEYAAELSDYINEDIRRNYKHLINEKIQITLIEALDHILSMYDKKISDFAEKRFSRGNIKVVTKTFVKGVKQDSVTILKQGEKDTQEIPCALTVWATGIKPRALVEHLRNKLGEPFQSNRRALLTNTHLEVKGAPSVFAVGDCSTMDTLKLTDSLLELFREADLDENGELDRAEFQRMVKKNIKKYPQLELIESSVEKAFDAADEKRSGAINLKQFEGILRKADSRIRALPATAQVANQEGIYLAKLFNQMSKQNQESIEEYGGYPSFRYNHMGSLAYVGADEAVIDLTNTSLFNFAMGGRHAFLLWRSFYFTEMFTTRTKMLLFFDWIRSRVYGRDISRI